MFVSHRDGLPIYKRTKYRKIRPYLQVTAATAEKERVPIILYDVHII